MAIREAHPDQALAAQRIGDAALAARALELGRDLGGRRRELQGSIGDAVRAAGACCERKGSGGLVAGLCIVSEYHDAEGRIVLYEDALAKLGEQVNRMGLASQFTPEVLADLAVAHELFHCIHRREASREIDAALERNRAAEEVAAHAFAAAFYGMPRTALVLEGPHDAAGRAAARPKGGRRLVPLLVLGLALGAGLSALADPVPSPSPSPAVALAAEPPGVTLPLGSATQVKISGSSGPFSVRGCSGTATAVIDGDVLSVTGSVSGGCRLLVSDRKGGSVVIQVLIYSEPES